MASSSLPVTGGCLCRAVRYQSATAPTKGYYCHCKMCQKNYGGLYMACVKFAGGDFSIIEGALTYYQSSAYARRGFCGTCGSPVAFRYEGSPDVWILLGSLDRPDDWPLTKDAQWGETVHTCVENRVAWHDIDDGLKRLTTDDMAARAAAVAHTAQTIPTSNMTA